MQELLQEPGLGLRPEGFESASMLSKVLGQEMFAIASSFCYSAEQLELQHAAAFKVLGGHQYSAVLGMRGPNIAVAALKATMSVYLEASNTSDPQPDLPGCQEPPLLNLLLLR